MKNTLDKSWIVKSIKDIDQMEAPFDDKGNAYLMGVEAFQQKALEELKTELIDTRFPSDYQQINNLAIQAAIKIIKNLKA